jgi:hypothetical protein
MLHPEMNGTIIIENNSFVLTYPWGVATS